MPLLLAGACESKANGTLSFRQGSTRGLIVLRRGHIAVVRSSEPVAMLGSILYEWRIIDMATANDSLREVAESNRLHGAILIERGAITQAQLDEALREQSFRKLEHLFLLPPETTWTFRENIDELAPARDAARPGIATWPAIWRCLRQRSPSTDARATLARFSGRIQLAFGSDIDRFALNDEEIAFCNFLAEQPRLLSRVLSQSSLPVGVSENLVFVLSLAKCLTVSAAGPLTPFDLDVPAIHAYAARLQTEDPYATLGLESGASRAEAQAAYDALAHAWDPQTLPSDLAEARGACALVHERLTQARKVIVAASDTLRAAAMRGLVTGSTANDSVAPPHYAPSMSERPPANASLASLAAYADRHKAISVRNTRDKKSENPTEQMLHARNCVATGDYVKATAIAMTIVTHIEAQQGLGASRSLRPLDTSARAIVVWCNLHIREEIDNLTALEFARRSLDELLCRDPTCIDALTFRANVDDLVARQSTLDRDRRRAARQRVSVAPRERLSVRPAPSLPQAAGLSAAPARRPSASPERVAAESIHAGLRKLLSDLNKASQQG